MSHSEAIVVKINIVGMFSNLEKVLLFISTFCKIHFGSISLITELGQQATLLMVGREIRKHMLRALWILKNLSVTLFLWFSDFA